MSRECFTQEQRDWIRNEIDCLLRQFQRSLNASAISAQPQPCQCHRQSNDIGVVRSSAVDDSSSSPFSLTSTSGAAATLTPVPTTSATTTMIPQPQQAQGVSTKQPCRSSECHETVSSFAPSAYGPHLRSQMHNFGTKSRTMTDRNGGVLFSDTRCECAGDHKFVSVPIYIDGNKLFEIENCLRCGKPRDTVAARACTQRLRELDPSAHVCCIAAGQKRAKRDDNSSHPHPDHHRSVG
jgi:hypothetical protein